MARNCPTPSNPKGGGKGGKAGGKGSEAGGKGRKALGKGVRNAHLLCTTCGKVGHLKDRCWQTYPDLQKKKKKVQVVDEEAPMMAIQIAAVDVCGNCDSLTSWSHVNKKGSVQTTVAKDNVTIGNFSVTGGNFATGNFFVAGSPRTTNGNPLKLLPVRDMTTRNSFGPLSEAEDHTCSPENLQKLLQTLVRRVLPPMKSFTQRRRASRRRWR